MGLSTLETILATASPFDDCFDAAAFDADVFDTAERLEPLEPLEIRDRQGRRLDLLARSLSWRLLSLRQVIDDAQATWSGCDDASWEAHAELC
jgi:hypothetical protein